MKIYEGKKEGIFSIEDSEWLKSWIMLLKYTIYGVFCKRGINYYIIKINTYYWYKVFTVIFSIILKLFLKGSIRGGDSNV